MIPWECGREGQLAVPPHFRRHIVATSFSPVTGAGRRGIGPPEGAVPPRAREGLHLGARDRLPSYRRLSLLACPLATRLRQRVAQQDTERVAAVAIKNSLAEGRVQSCTGQASCPVQESIGAMSRLSESVTRVMRILDGADLSADYTDYTVEQLLSKTTTRRSLGLSDLSPRSRRPWSRGARIT